ncbi:MAG: vWA domain-containing protein [Pirellulales bacterium]|nr:vWA domain-containing protein [Pirellulales bacterium]
MAENSAATAIPVTQVAYGSGAVRAAARLSSGVVAASYPTVPPYKRNWCPPISTTRRLERRLNNPNSSNWPSANASAIWNYKNKLGYLTYLQFMLDFGKDMKPDGSNVFTPLSTSSPNCVQHSEGTAGGTFNFPASAQPEHAARRSLIAALATIKERNDPIPNVNYRDHVTLITFDNLSGGDAAVIQPLTSNYNNVMQSSSQLQAVNDDGYSTATEAGMITAFQTIKPVSKGGTGRERTSKVVVLLTDGVPNLYRTPQSTIDNYRTNNPSGEFYNNYAYWYDAPLMQTAQMKGEKWDVYPVGLGVAADYAFLDKMARIGGTADAAGQAPRGTGDPAAYEAVLTDIFREIILKPRTQLVQ